MAECPGDRTTRGTRSQFRLGMPSLGQCKWFYPIHLGNIMDAGQSSQTEVLSSRDLVSSPSKGTRTRTVREYEQTISELKKENFDLKLKLYLCDEAMEKLSRKDKDVQSPNKNPVEIIVKLETEALQNELRYKDKLLEDALKRAEKFEIDFKELEMKYAELQSELSSLSELPSKEEYSSLLDEKENLTKYIESLEKDLTEKEEEIYDANQKLEILADKNSILEEKIKKSSIAVQGFVYKNYKEKEMLPDELKNIVISATQAAKKGNKDDLSVAVKRVIAALNEMCSVQALNESDKKENIESPQAKCLKEEFLEKSSAFLPSKNVSCTELSHIRSLKEVLAERNTPGSKHFNSLDSSVYEPCVKGKVLSESAVNIAERDTIDYLNFSEIPSVATENLISFSNRHSTQTCSTVEHNLIDIETVSRPSIPSDLMREKENLSKLDISSYLNKGSEESCQLIDVLKENEKLKLEIKEKLAIIQDLQAACKELELRGVYLKERDGDALKASQQYSVHTQTDIAGYNLLSEYEMTKLQEDSKLSDSVEELREDVLRLLLAVEDKNKELTDVKQSLLDVQEDLKKALNTTNVLDKDYYMSERNELHERLARSCSINEGLLKQLKNLEKFMEDLLQNKFNSSIESMSEKSDFITKCLNESLKLSYALSDNLSICEGSKLFEECESLLYKNGSYFDEKSLPYLDLSQLNIPNQYSSSYPGTHIHEDFIPFVRNCDKRMNEESDGSQLCRQCWQQLNSPMSKSEISHQIQNTIVHKNIGYPSSESDIWSEPDRNISMQRIGISLQNSPVSSKSARKLRLKEKRMSSRLSSDQNTSSSESQRLSKKRHGSAYRRLFSTESIKNQDFTSEKFYFLLAEKYSKLKSLLNELENVKDGKISEEVLIRMNAVVASLGEACQKLHIARENAKNFPSAICGKCIMLELFADLKASHKVADVCVDDSSSEQEILQQFLKEILLLMEVCKEPFSLFSEVIDKRSQSTQSGSLDENEHIKINELENVIVNLNDKNKELSENLDDVNRLLNIEKEVLESVKIENFKLSRQINHLKEELSNMKQKEKELILRNEELTEELTNVNKNNSELNCTLQELEEKRKESSVALDQLTAELQKNKLNLVNMSKKCSEYENELNQQISKKEECEDKLKTLEYVSLNEKKEYLNQIDDLNAEKKYFIKQLETVQENKLAVEKENVILNNNLKSRNNELSSLQESIKKLQEAKVILNANCAELQIELKNAREHVENLQNKCSSYEHEVLAKCEENKAEYCQQLQQLEAKSLSEKQRLLAEISVLTNEREDIMQKLKNEKECYARLMKEKVELNQNYVQSCQQISSLKLVNEELKNKQLTLIQKNEFFEKALNSSNSECNTLNQDLKCLRETLQNLESKCVMYEKELVAAAGMKDTAVECLLNINNEFFSQRQKLNEICKVYGNENYVSRDKSSEFIPVIDEDNVEKLCKNVSSESKKLLQSVDIILGLLKNVHLKSVEAKASEEKHKTCIKKQTEFHKDQIEHLKSQNDNLQQVIDELQKSISEKEKSVQFSAYEIQSLKEKLHNTENEIERGNRLLKRKDDEITMLQERIFNLQTYVNSIMADKSNLHDKTSSFDQKFVDGAADSSPPDNQLPSQSCVKVSKMCQTNQYEDPCQSADDTFSSTSTLERSKNSCCEKYREKCHSLQTKLSVKKKHIEILQKEKNDLREHFLQQLQDKQDSSEKKDSLSTKLAELESMLEQKKSFINELKGELLKTCNSLIDKEKELDALKQKLSEYETKSKDVIPDMHDRHSIVTNTVDTNIKTLKNYKWRLIQTIFDIQKKFYEKKGIHLNYFERFKDHVNNLYSMQLTQSFSKSESMPLLGSHAEKLQYDQNDRLKNLVGLELDIECLENLKIFLDRFFVPCVLQTSQTDVKSVELEDERKKISSDRLTLQAEVEKSRSSKLQGTDMLDVSFPDIFITRVSSDHKGSSQEKAFSFENFATNVSHHLDCIEKFFIAIRKCLWLEDFDASSKECTDKTEVKSLLLKILQEIKVLHESSHTLFDLNSLLKTVDFVVAAPIPITSNRLDISDRESLMSEETIAVSRSESPLSFEDVCPIKLPCPEMLQLEEKTLKPESLRNRSDVIEPYSTKGTTIESSCDSVCQRSHYSSPDLGIESDPNHDSSAPEQKDDGINKYQKCILKQQQLLVKTQQKTAFTSTESAGRLSGYKFGEALFAIGNLPQYELLKKEVKESLVAIKSVLSRTGDGLHHIAKYTSPRKTLEYSTLKSIKDTCVHIEVCLKAAYELVGKFWTAPCPSENEWKLLNDENQSLSEQLAILKGMIEKQESEFKKAMGKLEHAQVVKASMEKKISKKLVKTKKVIRQAELKLLENRCQNFPPVPKYPSDQTEQSPQANLVQKM